MSEACDSVKVTVDTLCLRQLPNSVSQLVPYGGQKIS
jgi:hypothetical protein